MSDSTTREQWLLKATGMLRDGIFKQAGAEIPIVRVSVGFPGGARVSSLKAIGQYWHAAATNDGIPQVFVSPVLDDGARALDVLVHELVHACTPGEGHGPVFRKLALAVGLTGKMTATTATPELSARLNAMMAGELGAYPHSGLNPSAGKKKQSTRLLKCECQSCGYTVRVTSKWLDIGAPICPCNGESMEVAL